MRYQGVAKIVLLFAVNLVLLQMMFGIVVGIIFLILICIYILYGEKIVLLHDKAIKLEDLTGNEKEILKKAMKNLSEKVYGNFNQNISGLKVYLIPDEGFNAYAYGGKSIGITRGALKMCNGLSIQSILAHEVNHILSLDVMFNKLFLITYLLSVSKILSFLSPGIAIAWALLFLLCVSRVNRTRSKVFMLLQFVFVFLYILLARFFSRGGEYRADEFSFQNCGSQLASVLEKYVLPREVEAKIWESNPFNTHPSTTKRIERLYEYGYGVKRIKRVW